MLSTTTLAAFLPSKRLGQSLFVFKELPSTNTYALALVKKSIEQGTVVLADKQTAGRGRLQRKWFSPPCANIYGSLIFSIPHQFQALGWIPLMAGTALAQAIQEETNIKLNLKWPNDVLLNDLKVGGILCESIKGDRAETHVVIGFGINVNLSESDFPKELETTATSLQIHVGQPLDRHQLLKIIIPSLERSWETLITHGPSTFHDLYNARCSTLGRQILVQFPDQKTLQGKAQSIGQEGQLQILTSSSDDHGQSARIVDVRAGDVLHVKKFSDPYR